MDGWMDVRAGGRALLWFSSVRMNAVLVLQDLFFKIQLSTENDQSWAMDLSEKPSLNQLKPDTVKLYNKSRSITHDVTYCNDFIQLWVFTL